MSVHSGKPYMKTSPRRDRLASSGEQTDAWKAGHPLMHGLLGELGPRKVLLPLAQHEPRSVKQVRGLRGPLGILDTLVIRVRTALLDGAACRTLGCLLYTSDAADE